jgi:hypothetical protein
MPEQAATDQTRIFEIAETEGIPQDPEIQGSPAQVQIDSAGSRKSQKIQPRVPDLKEEQDRFNALSPQEAQAIIDNEEVSMRSCWYCNGAHEHLQNASHPLFCWLCGIRYMGGYPTHILSIRASGKKVNKKHMEAFKGRWAME